MPATIPSSAPPHIRVLGALIGRYALAGAVATTALGAVGWALRASGPPAWLVYAAGIGAAAGALSGCGLALVLALLALSRGTGRIALVFCGALAFAVYAVQTLGVKERLHGAYATLALAALLGIALLCVSGALLALALAPRELASFAGARDTWLARTTPRTRRALLTLLAAAAATLLVADATLLVGDYAFIHAVLRRSARLGGVVVVAELARVTGRKAQLCTAASALALALLAIASLSAGRVDALAALREAELVGLALSELQALGDVDADGFSAWLGGGDCAPLDPDVHPRAREIPGNGIDDNCRLGDLRAQSTMMRAQPHAAAKPRALGVVLITIDTLRADHVGLYGYSRPTTPHIDAWFREATRYSDAIAAGAYTTISMPALMRGTYARRLAWKVAQQTDRFRLFLSAQTPALARGERIMNAHLIAMDAARPTLAERMRDLGYRTLAVVDDGGSGFLSRAIMGSGFEQYVYVPDATPQLWDPRGDERVADEALRTLQATAARPFFLWLHFYGAHAPDARHAGLPRFGEDTVSRYDHEIANVDHQLGRVFAAIEALRDTLPIITLLTADHGERFDALGRAHGTSLNEEEIAVPLLARGPGFAAATVRSTVSLVDVLPTVMALTGREIPDGLDGVDLRAAPGRTRRAVLSDVWRYDALGRIELERSAAVDARDRVVFDLLSNTVYAYARPSQRTRFPAPPALERQVFEYLERTFAEPDALLP